MDIKSWLEAINCGAYAGAFAENAITPDLFADLTDADLRELGMNIGDRKRFMRAVAESQAGAQPAPVPARKTPAAGAEAPTHAERRRLTVMFVDLVGSTVLSGRLDPEELSDVLRDYQDIVAGLVTRLGGHVGQYLGDGVLCYFGWPKASEDSAERAVEAGLEIIEGINRIKTLDEPLTCRIGIATGLVIVGELIGRSDVTDRTAIGETPNFAARLQAFAKSNQIVISESTRRLLGNAFILESLGERHFKGISGQQPIYAVIGSNPEHDRFSAREGMTTGAIVGRDNELALLLDRWALVRGGEGQAITLVGEAGIGKSRICRALFEEIDKEKPRRIPFQCSPYHRDTALWPVISQFTAMTGIKPEDSNDQRLDKLESVLGETGERNQTAVALLADLLGLNGEGRYGEIAISPSARRAATFSALADYFTALSKRDPLLLFFEDAHWADPTTAELIGTLIDQQARRRIMVLITSRPENEIALPQHTHVSSVTLNRLGRKGVQEIVSRLGGNQLPPETIEAIIERTDGIPLFVEELTKVMVESGDMSVPASLHDTLMARLDRLPEVKEVAQIASVFGREFDTDPLADVANLSRHIVVDALEKLRKVELVFPRLEGEGRHLFKHALVRDAAYESLLNRRRQEIHGRIFDVLCGNESSMPGVLAHHAAEAKRMREAVEFGCLAAEQALRRPAYAEAIAHLDTALGVLAGQDTSEATQRERMRLLLLSGEARIAHFGYAAETTTATYAEIESIARQIGDKEMLINGLYGRWAGHYVPGRLPIALEVADTICEVSAGIHDNLARALGKRLRGTVLTMMGRTAEATEALAEAEALYDPVKHGRFASRFGQDVGTAAKCYRTGVLTLEGRLDQAALEAGRVLQDLARVNHAHTSAYALGHLALFLSAAEIIPLGADIARQCIELSERDRMPLWAALGRASLGMAHLHEGRGAEAITELRSGIDMLRKLDFAVFLPILLPPFATALARSGDLTAATSQIAEASEMALENEAGFFEAEIARAEGELLVLQGNHLSATACFEHALSRAREQGHLGWELRAAENLADVLSQNGRRKDGRKLLVSVFERFTEGRTMPSLQRVARKIAEMA